MTGAVGRAGLIERGLRLEYLTVGWNAVEAVVAIVAAALAGSPALLGFGIDSIVESASGTVLIWRLRAERRGSDAEAVERLERTASRLVAVSLAALAIYVAWESATSLVDGERPEPSLIGIALALASLGVMWWLARAKRRVARGLDSRAMAADAFQTDACFWLSLFLLVGIGLNAALGWWWADPVAALAMAVVIAREGVEAWRGESDPIVEAIEASEASDHGTA
ncbi:MAG TPA: cation transporter [Candidatus Limnocylindrales bacterium]|nr:cation transporter [Candidatus Limnocylindrales bacterium]